MALANTPQRSLKNCIRTYFLLFTWNFYYKRQNIKCRKYAFQTYCFSYCRLSVMRSCATPSKLLETYDKQIGVHSLLYLGLLCTGFLAQWRAFFLMVRGECHTSYAQSMCKIEVLSAVCGIGPNVAYMWRWVANLLKDANFSCFAFQTIIGSHWRDNLALRDTKIKNCACDRNSDKTL